MTFQVVALICANLSAAVAVLTLCDWIIPRRTV